MQVSDARKAGHRSAELDTIKETTIGSLLLALAPSTFGSDGRKPSSQQCRLSGHLPGARFLTGPSSPMRVDKAEEEDAEPADPDPIFNALWTLDHLGRSSPTMDVQANSRGPEIPPDLGARSPSDLCFHFPNGESPASPANDPGTADLAEPVGGGSP